MPIRSVRTAVFEFTCDRCNDSTQVEQPPAEGLDDYGDDGAGHYHNDDPPTWRHNSEEWPPGWNELRLEGTPGRHAISYTLLCTACTTDLAAFIGDDDDGSGTPGDDDDDDDDGPESVPEGAEGKGPGWSVTLGAAGTPAEDATTGLGAPPSTEELLEVLRQRRAVARVRLDHRKLCDGPLHVAGGLHSCPHTGWVKRGDHDLCLVCAQAYDQLMAPPVPRADVCLCGHLRALHALSELSEPGWLRCTCTLDGGAPCDCLEYRSERTPTAATW